MSDDAIWNKLNGLEKSQNEDRLEFTRLQTAMQGVPDKLDKIIENTRETAQETRHVRELAEESNQAVQSLRNDFAEAKPDIDFARAMRTKAQSVFVDKIVTVSLSLAGGGAIVGGIIYAVMQAKG